MIGECSDKTLQWSSQPQGETERISPCTEIWEANCEEGSFWAGLAKLSFHEVLKAGHTVGAWGQAKPEEGTVWSMCNPCGAGLGWHPVVGFRNQPPNTLTSALKTMPLVSYPKLESGEGAQKWVQNEAEKKRWLGYHEDWNPGQAPAGVVLQ